MLSLILGVGITFIFTLLFVKWIINFEPTFTEHLRGYIGIGVSMFIMMLFGLCLIYISLLKKPVIKIYTFDNQMFLEPLTKNKKQLINIVNFLSNCDVKLINRLSINVG